MERLNKVLSHFESISGNLRKNNVSNFESNQLDEIVIVSCKRTALCRSRRGGFKDTLPPDLLAPVIKNICKDIDPLLVSDVVIGNVLAIGTHRHVECRQACFIAGLPETPCVR